MKRRSAIPVVIGNLPLGSDYPVRIQSMANTLTADVNSSIDQCIRIIEAGADYVRFTVPSLADAESFAMIKRGLREKGFTTPLIADVHFNPDIALKVAEYADKVRINPGNFRDPSKFVDLIRKCKVRNVPIRIGVNHGSLSESIMDRFGDTPLGMAESAMEFLRVCKSENFDQVVVSMKSSNVRIMVFATRLIAGMMDKEGLSYPLHLGVTEAGEGEDGRIKSAIGIGTLLSEGLGDTIRVSLTEDPEAEIPVARKIVSVTAENRVGEKENERKGDRAAVRTGERESLDRGRFEYSKRKSKAIENIGGHNVPVVWGFDYISPGMNTIETDAYSVDEIIDRTDPGDNAVLIYRPSLSSPLADLANLRVKLDNDGCNLPVIFRLHLADSDRETFMLKAASYLGGAFIDGFGDGIWLTGDIAEKKFIIETGLGILQACRARMSKTEYISCPSCGRTHFNLMETVAKIKTATSHLKGLKIGIMGCIVNGPGEMADADYGYVGAGKGKITLYKAREIVKKGIPEEKAVDELILLIKDDGLWIDPKS